jgi:hypothetical protein
VNGRSIAALLLAFPCIHALKVDAQDASPVATASVPAEEAAARSRAKNDKVRLKAAETVFKSANKQFRHEYVGNGDKVTTSPPATLLAAEDTLAKAKSTYDSSVSSLKAPCLGVTNAPVGTKRGAPYFAPVVFLGPITAGSDLGNKGFTFSIDNTVSFNKEANFKATLTLVSWADICAGENDVAGTTRSHKILPRDSPYPDWKPAHFGGLSSKDSRWAFDESANYDDKWQSVGVDKSKVTQVYSGSAANFSNLLGVPTTLLGGAYHNNSQGIWAEGEYGIGLNKHWSAYDDYVSNHKYSPGDKDKPKEDCTRDRSSKELAEDRYCTEEWTILISGDLREVNDFPYTSANFNRTGVGFYALLTKGLGQPSAPSNGDAGAASAKESDASSVEYKQMIKMDVLGFAPFSDPLVNGRVGADFAYSYKLSDAWSLTVLASDLYYATVPPTFGSTSFRPNAFASSIGIKFNPQTKARTITK